MLDYLNRHPKHVSAMTILERVGGYALLWRRGAEEKRPAIEISRTSYLEQVRHVWPVDASVAVVAGEIMALLPDPPTPPRRAQPIGRIPRRPPGPMAG